ncbi:MAG: hypothetical protein H6702_21825 [Myxococcales bacterium]|nr:hypothetical protein [Myxococcales bacterium]
MFRSLFALLVAFACAAPAAAQDIKPRILLIFDTSGSMGFDLDNGLPTGGDNSEQYPGNGGLSRLAVAKQVISDIVQTTSEVEFGLMRYPQVEGSAINDGTDREPFTGYRGLAQNPLNYLGFCNGELRRDRADTSYALLEPFGPDNENGILSWLDGREAWPVDRELRAEGPTPIAESLRLAERYLRTEVLAQDPQIQCRQTYVVLLTDGAESCVPGMQQPVLLERTLALREIPVEQDGVQIQASVKVFVVAFAVDPAQQGLLDTIARVGGTARSAQGQVDLINGRAFAAADQAGLRRAFSEILAEAIPTERCNGEDDDCDGAVDEGVINACGQCGAPPAEVCNGADDDCDGFSDEGVTNRCGGCGPLPAEACNGIDDDCDGAVDENVVNACGGCANVRDEVCNGLDDDCDGVVDNVPGDDVPLARPCSSDVGECVAGVERCVGAQWGACDGVTPADEICDDLDNDCDGATDEVTRPCGDAVDIGDVGQCRVGRESCVDGMWSGQCFESVAPAGEICDGLDNDCDGVSDEGLINECGVCGKLPPEICNGRDDNCDGLIDEDARCPGTLICWVGACVERCDASGECPGGQTCRDAWGGVRLCHPDPCAGVVCAPGLRCDPDLGGCADPCRQITCDQGEVCELGECVPPTCRHTGCAEGERCVNDTCGPDPCAGVGCEGDRFCREGECVDACVEVDCTDAGGMAGGRCVDGECEGDACGGRCPRGQSCDGATGHCTEDPCVRVTCPRGQACVDGECRGDAPCAFIDCPAGTWCVDGTCTDGAPSGDPFRRQPLPGGAGGEGGAGGVGGQGGMGGVGGARPDQGPQGGAGGAGGGSPADVGPPTMADPGDDGCNCRVDGRAPPSPWLALGLLGWLGVRRRRR